MLVFESNHFVGMVMQFGIDVDFKESFTMKEDAQRFDVPDLSAGKYSFIEHWISFSIRLPDGDIVLQKSLSMSVDEARQPVATRTAALIAGSFTVLQLEDNVSNNFTVRILLDHGEHFLTGFTAKPKMLKKCTDLMSLGKYEHAIKQTCCLEVRIPRIRASNPIVDNAFAQLKEGLKALSTLSSPAISPSFAIASTPQHRSLISRPIPIRASLKAVTDTRRVQGADFGQGFMALSADEKIDAIDKKIRNHVKDGKQLKECEDMIKEFEQAVELDNAVGPLGNGNVTSQISRMTKEEVPHEMLDLFLMTGRLRVQKRKEGANKKRKWDITGF